MYNLAMFKRVITYILIAVMSLIIFAGCSSADNDQDKPFNAKEFVDDCRILAPESKFKQSEPVDFAAYYTKVVFEQFGKSNYYKEMTAKEREDAFNSICKVLTTYSYCNVPDGFIDEYTVDIVNREILWHVKGMEPDVDSLWQMPGN